MRKITRQLVLLFVVFVVYFGYSAFVDGAALFHTAGQIVNIGGSDVVIDPGIQIGSAGWVSLNIVKDAVTGSWVIHDGGNTIVIAVEGYMAPNSLLYTILSPFKLVLVGGVFAMLVPLTKSIFFGTFIGIKEYMKARRTNILFNYQKTISFVVDLNSKLGLGDYEQVKAQYAAFSGLAFKPTFLVNMMDEIGDTLIREMDVTPYIKPSEVLIVGLKEMYEKERKAAISLKPNEMFFDFKRGYEYTSIGSRYSIAYYKALETGADKGSKLGWKLFSLEMFRFYVFMLFAIIPTVIVSAIILPLLSKFTGIAGNAAPAVIIVTFFAFAIIFHAIGTLTKNQYRNMLKDVIVPAVIYYVLILVLAITFSAGVINMTKMSSITDPGTASSMMWEFFAALGYTILSTTIVLYIIATLMDANKNPLGMTKKVMIDGVILPIIAWILSTGMNFVAPIANLDRGLWSGVAFAVLIAFWVYLSISGVLLNNIVFPSRKKKMIIQSELAQQGQEAEQKKADKAKKQDQK